MKNQYEGEMAKKGGAWTVCRFKGRGFARKRGGLYPNAHYVDLNFLLTSCFVIFTVFCFSDGIFSSALSIHSASRLCSTFLLHIPFENVVASSTFGGFAFSSLPSRFFKKIYLGWSGNSCRLEIVLFCCHIV